MKREMIVLTSVIAASVWLGFTAIGAEEAPKGAGKWPNVSPQKGKQGTAAGVSLLHQAGELVRYARENESPEAMLTAVQMIRRVRIQEDASRVGSKKSEPQDKGEAKKEGKKGTALAPSLDASKLLEEAGNWAKGDEHLTALLKAEKAKQTPSGSATLGAVGGPKINSDRVLGRSVDSYFVSFRGGEVARIAVIGDGDTDLDLFVYDENGEEIVKDIDLTDRCLVQWTPKWTGKYRVRILNNGSVYNNYLLMTN